VGRGQDQHRIEFIFYVTNHDDKPLSQEILDYTIDLLHDKPEILKRCCLVSKSWVPRTRKYLFADIKFHSADDLGSWKKTFPDIANSPAYYARTLSVGCPRLVIALDGEEGCIRAFSGVTSLHLDSRSRHLSASEVSLAPFYKFSPSLKSLCMGPIIFPYPGLFDFILSFPLLEDLSLTGYGDPQFDDDGPYGTQTTVPLMSPPLTGSLDFHIFRWAGDVAQRLLDLPNGLESSRSRGITRRTFCG